MLRFIRDTNWADVEKIVCFKGHHRAMAVAEKQGKKLHLRGSVRIAIAQLPAREVHLLDELTDRGSARKSL